VQTARQRWELTPDTLLEELRGIGQARAALLRTAGLQTVRDLLFYFPFRYEDRTKMVQVAELRRLDQPVTIRGRIRSAALKTSPVKRLKIFEAMLDDGTGSLMLVWFNQPFLKEQLQRGDEIVVYGQPRLTSYGRFQMENPDYERVDEATAGEEGRILPVYSAISAINSKLLRRMVEQALPAAAFLDDPLPADIRGSLGVSGLIDAIVHLHHPETIDDTLLEQRSPAHERITVEEFFAFQLALQLRRGGEEQREKPRQIEITDAIRESVRKVLPFALTRAQKRVLKEIADDLRASRPMYRLLQGDVGSGKTIVALIAALLVIRNGHQAALLAPTEILAEQHFERISQLLADSGVRVGRLTGSTPTKERRELLAELKAGNIDLLVGTHALLEPKVEFRSLALAIVDEQHRFGVVQRQKLFAKGSSPDILVMTATPIPRSLAISLYGDLDLSVIDELPPGRQPVRTVVRGSSQLPKILAFAEEQLEQGSQVYIVYPIIEESEKLDLKPLLVGVETIRAAMPERRIAVLHGRMSSEEKEATMNRFEGGEIDVLVSTTVIEVGIDVPNASLMIILDADRFGLAQLHQLRGRVGRGSAKSYCVLVRNEKAKEEAKARLRDFEKTTDGFAVAEMDLALRGAGDFFGTRQAGAPRFRFGNILRDHDWMERARRVAIEVIDRDGVSAATKLLKGLTSGSPQGPIGKD
jgi:ATP-dependent DNA helicase RecG